MMSIAYQPHTRRSPITDPWEPLFAREMAEWCAAIGWLPVQVRLQLHRFTRTSRPHAAAA